jgi:hypothetical protein
MMEIKGTIELNEEQMKYIVNWCVDELMKQPINEFYGVAGIEEMNHDVCSLYDEIARPFHLPKLEDVYNKRVIEIIRELEKEEKGKSLVLGSDVVEHFKKVNQ